MNREKVCDTVSKRLTHITEQVQKEMNRTGKTMEEVLLENPFLNGQLYAATMISLDIGIMAMNDIESRSHKPKESQQ